MTLRPRGALAVPAVFAALVLATFAAFFVTTKLKRSPPIVEQLEFRRHFSPNGDGRLDRETVVFRLRKTDDVTVAIVSDDNDEVATLADDVRLTKGKHRYNWDGRGDDSQLVPDGEYHVLVRLRHQGRAVKSPRKLFVDTTPPRPVVKSVSPDAIYPGVPGQGTARLRFIGPTRKAPTLLVYETGGRSPRLVARREGRKDSGKITWDGRVGLGARTSRAPAGNYMFVVRTRDAAGNDGPVGPPPPRGKVKGHPGVIVRYLAAVAPKQAVRAGHSAEFAVLTGGRRYKWGLTTTSSPRRVVSGSSRAAKLRVHIPRSKRSRVWLLDLRLGSRHYSTPFAVQGSRHQSVLVVLPRATWMARDPVDSNGDGYADLLPADKTVPASRPIAGDGLPAGFSSEVAPLLEYLGREGLEYDIATDLAPPLGDHRGVLFAGSPKFELERVSVALREFATVGNSVAWVGTGGFGQATRLVKDQLLRTPSPPGRNAFGEAVRVDPAGGLLAVGVNRNGLFNGVPDTFGPFPGTELQTSVPADSKREAAAGPLDEGPAIVTYGLGRGTITRIGVSGFGQSLSPDSGLDSGARIMRNLWNLLRS